MIELYISINATFTGISWFGQINNGSGKDSRQELLNLIGKPFFPTVNFGSDFSEALRRSFFTGRKSPFTFRGNA